MLGAMIHLRVPSKLSLVVEVRFPSQNVLDHPHYGTLVFYCSTLQNDLVHEELLTPHTGGDLCE